MGKALIFDGFIIDSPLRTITIRTELNTGKDYVTQYANLCNNLSENDKDLLIRFIDDLISYGIWDCISNFYPLLGGLDGYMYDLKNVYNQKSWKIPSTTTWNSEKKSLNFKGLGKEDGKALELPFDWQNGGIILGYERTGGRYIIDQEFRYTAEDSYEHGIKIDTSSINGGSKALITPRGTIMGTSKVGALNNGIWGVFFDTENIITARMHYGSDLYYLFTEATNKTEYSNISIALGGYYDEVITGMTFIGNIHFILVCNSNLSESNVKILFDKLYILQKNIGRINIV